MITGVQEPDKFFVYQPMLVNSFTGVGSLCREFIFVVRNNELTVYKDYEQIYKSAPLPFHVQGIATAPLCEEDDEDGDQDNSPISIILAGYEGEVARYIYYPSENVLDSDWCIELYQSICDFIILNGLVVILSNSRVVILQSDGSLFREMPFEGVGINLTNVGGNVIVVETNKKTYSLKLSKKAALSEI
jgi:hypothetical protein